MEDESGSRRRSRIVIAVVASVVALWLLAYLVLWPAISGERAAYVSIPKGTRILVDVDGCDQEIPGRFLIVEPRAGQTAESFGERYLNSLSAAGFDVFGPQRKEDSLVNGQAELLIRRTHVYASRLQDVLPYKESYDCALRLIPQSAMRTPSRYIVIEISDLGD